MINSTIVSEICNEISPEILSQILDGVRCRGYKVKTGELSVSLFDEKQNLFKLEVWSSLGPLMNIDIAIAVKKKLKEYGFQCLSPFYGNLTPIQKKVISVVIKTLISGDRSGKYKISKRKTIEIWNFLFFRRYTLEGFSDNQKKDVKVLLDRFFSSECSVSRAPCYLH